MKTRLPEVHKYITFCTFGSMDNKLNRIKEVLVRQGISQKNLAAQLEKNEHTVSNRCVNKSQPHLKELYRIAEILDVDICDLLTSQKSKT
jgi:transcriptional regulator with XRE-family HTH domain